MLFYNHDSKYLNIPLGLNVKLQPSPPSIFKIGAIVYGYEYYVRPKR